MTSGDDAIASVTLTVSSGSQKASTRVRFSAPIRGPIEAQPDAGDPSSWFGPTMMAMAAGIAVAVTVTWVIRRWRERLTAA